jgi:hypothetical protein
MAKQEGMAWFAAPCRNPETHRAVDWSQARRANDNAVCR